MATSDLLRHQVIINIAEQHTVGGMALAIALWEQMAIQIVSIVGVDGLTSLYARSIFLSQPRFPWLAASPLPPQTEHRFAELKMSLEGQTPAQASEANSLLLITFTDILASLIGEQLMIRILGLAWGTDNFK